MGAAYGKPVDVSYTGRNTVGAQLLAPVNDRPALGLVWSEKSVPPPQKLSMHGLCTSGQKPLGSWPGANVHS